MRSWGWISGFFLNAFSRTRTPILAVVPSPSIVRSPRAATSSISPSGAPPCESADTSTRPIVTPALDPDRGSAYSSRGLRHRAALAQFGDLVGLVPEPGEDLVGVLTERRG